MQNILDDHRIETKNNPFLFIQIYIAISLTGAILGAVTNFVNGAISQEYFKTIMRWNFSNGEIWFKAIKQGINEGGRYGSLFGIIFTLLFLIITKTSGNWNLAKKVLLKTIPIILAFWIIGGIIAIFIAFISWNFFDKLIVGVPQDIIKRIRFSWVGGSIWGEITGIFIAFAYSIFLTIKLWFFEKEKTA